MVDVWEEMFGIDIEEGPQIGLVDISEVAKYIIIRKLVDLRDPNTVNYMKNILENVFIRNSHVILKSRCFYIMRFSEYF